MSFPARRTQGYSLIEILVVLAIFGILSVVGVSMLGNRRGASVRSLLDEMEGSLETARKAAYATGRDMAIDSWGTWTAAAPVVMAFGDASLTDNQIQATANNLLASTAADPTIPYSQTVAVPFHFMPNDMTHSRACVVVATADTTSWTTAMTAAASGAVNTDINSVDPFKANDLMAGMVVSANSFFNSGAIQRMVISGSNQRFTGNYIIQVVGTSPSGGALPGSPMGLIVVLANGASIYKFYNPGVLEGDGRWRRI
jgi:prepilin-type N-terminal cleavage/methylation domain-containing protein